MIIRRYLNSHSVTLTCGAIVQFTAIQAFFDPANRSAVARISKAACLAAGNTAIGLHNRMGGLSVRNDRANVKLKLPTAIPTDKQAPAQETAVPARRLPKPAIPYGYW